MTRGLTTDQRREYLRVLLASGPDAARTYVNAVREPRMCFPSSEALEAYEKETGQRVTHWCLIPANIWPNGWDWL